MITSGGSYVARGRGVVHRIERGSESDSLSGQRSAARGFVGAGLRVDVGSGLDQGALGRKAPQGMSACDVVGGEESGESALVLGPDFAEDSISGLEKIRFGFRVGGREKGTRMKVGLM